MPKIYTSGKRVEDLGAVVHGAVTIVLDSIKDLAVLKALFRLAARPPEDPLVSINKTLSDPGFSWQSWQQFIESEWNSHKTEEPWTEIPKSSFHQLLATLHIASELWEEAKGDASELRLSIMVADQPARTSKGINVEGQGPVFAFYPGSILAEIVRLPLQAPIWIVCFSDGRGTTPSARAPHSVSELRALALQNGARPLPSILDIAKIPKPNQPLVVLIHGLFSTDVGTFNGLQGDLEERFQDNVVGFPHETVATSIEANASELARVLLKLKPNRVVFVAHSRGGLVARRTALHLKQDRLKGKTASVVTHCVTFGTPHYGATLAENPGKLVAAAVLLHQALNGPSFLIDALCCFAEGKNFPGISDLKPDGALLRKLEEKEGSFPDDDFPIFAFGGAIVPTTLRQRVVAWLARGLLGNVANDLVVPLSSSRPRLRNVLPESCTLACSHFDYFRSLATEPNTIGSLKRALGPDTDPLGAEHLASAAIALKDRESPASTGLGAQAHGSSDR